MKKSVKIEQNRLLDELTELAGTPESHKVLLTLAEWTDKKIEATTYVYAIQAENGYIKFGISRVPEERFSALNVASPIPLKLLGYVHGSPALERFLHRICAENHVKGEWFRPGGLVDRFSEVMGNYDLDAFEELIDNL